MKMSAPLAKKLGLSLVALAVRRLLAWLASSIALLSLGALVSSGLGIILDLQLGLAVLLASALPVLLLWPPPATILQARLRELDEDTVFEAYLEAPPGSARELLREVFEEKAEAIKGRGKPLRFGLRGLRSLVVASLAAIALAELGSLLFFKHPLLFYGDGETRTASGSRLEDEEFADFVGEGSDIRRRQEGEDIARGALGGEGGEEAGIAGASRGELPSGIAAARRPRRGTDDASLPGGLGPSTPAPGGNGGLGSNTEADGRDASTSPEPGEAEASASNGGGTRLPAPLGRSGQGFEKTGNTRVPSPLLDYRARFSSVFAERTGKRISAGDELGLGELRDYERRYFDSFALKADIGPSEDPYAALLKRRWRDLRQAWK